MTFVVHFGDEFEVFLGAFELDVGLLLGKEDQQGDCKLLFGWSLCVCGGWGGG